jgi:hypothetical protein
VRWFAHVVAAVVAGLVAPALPGCGRIGLNDVPKDAAVDAAAPDTAIPDAIDASVIDPCAPTYTTMIGQSYYRFSGTPTSWDIAEHACEADGRGSHLVVFGGTLEMNKVEEMVSGTELWVGVTDRVTDGTFLDVMGELPAFLPGWQAMDPSFAGPGCVKFNPSSRLIHDQDCMTQVAYVCECDGVLARPSSF